MEQQSRLRVAKEIWRTINWSPNYEISNQGRIRRSYSAPKHGISVPGNIRKLVKRRANYWYVDLPDKGGGIRRCRVGRLVLESFVGPPPSAFHQCNHKDNDKANDYADNLEWVTPRQNIEHSAKLDKRRSKLTNHIAKLIKEIPNQFYSRKQIAEQFGVSPQTVTNIRKGRSWKHLE